MCRPQKAHPGGGQPALTPGWSAARHSRSSWKDAARDSQDRAARKYSPLCRSRESPQWRTQTWASAGTRGRLGSSHRLAESGRADSIGFRARRRSRWLPQKTRRPIPAGLRPPFLRNPEGQRSSRELHGSIEGRVRVLDILEVSRNVENERAITEGQVTADFVGDGVNAPYEIGAHCLVVLERHEPVRTIRHFVLQHRQIAMPFRIGYF